MSTLRCTNLQDTSGGNSLTTAQIYNGAAKAWVNFNGTGTVAIRASFNVSSITDNGVGDYTVNFTTALTDANYVFNACGYTSKTYNENDVNIIRSTTQIRMSVRESSNAAYTDVAQISVSVFR